MMPPSAAVMVLGPAAAGHTLVSGRLSVGRNAVAGRTCAIAIIRTHVRPAGEVESVIEHQFELLSTVRAPSDKTHGPAGIRAGRPSREESRVPCAPSARWTVAHLARRLRRLRAGPDCAVQGHLGRGLRPGLRAERKITRGRYGRMPSPTARAASPANVAARTGPMASSQGRRRAGRDGSAQAATAR